MDAVNIAIWLMIVLYMGLLVPFVSLKRRGVSNRSLEAAVRVAFFCV